MARDDKDASDTPDEVIEESSVEESKPMARAIRPNDPWPIDPYVESGIFLAQHLNELVDAIDSTNFGTTRPSYAVVGTMWCKQESSGKFSLYIYNGSTDLLVSDSDGIGLEEIDLTALTNYLQTTLDFGVTQFGPAANKRKGDVTPMEGDYKITQLEDVAITSPTDKQGLVYQAGQWKNLPIVNSFNGRSEDVVPAEADYKLEMLGDVALNNLTKDDMLQFNGTSWENNPPKLIDTELQFAGPINPTVAAPTNVQHAWIYIANTKGNAHPSFTGLNGQNVNVGNALGYSTNHNANGDWVGEGNGGAWFLLGDVFSAGVTSIGQGAGILVDSSNASSPVVSVNRTTVDAWYADKNHNHDTLYSKLGHTHSEYAPVDHRHDNLYEPKFSKNTAFNKNFGSTSGTVAEGNHGHSGYALTGHTHSEYAPKSHTHSEYEPKITTKYSAFNKNFGTGYSDCARGDHTHASQPPSAHNQALSTISGGVAINDGKHFVFPTQVTAQSSLSVSGGFLSVTQYITANGYIYSGNVIRSAGDVIAYYSSDERLKENIRPIENALDKVCQIRGISFEWNDKQDDYEGEDVGVSAQSVQAVFPSLVKEREKDGHLGVRYEKLAGPMIAAISELTDMVRDLQAEVAELKSKLGDQS